MIETLLTLFVFGSLGFWGLLALASLLIILALDDNQGTCATIIFVLAAVAFLICGNAGEVASKVTQHPYWTFFGAVGYYVIGAGSGIAGWYLHVKEAVTRYKEEQTSWLHTRLKLAKDVPEYTSQIRVSLGTGTLHPDLKAEWKSWLKAMTRYNRRKYAKPMAADNKGRIISWMQYWPWNAVRVLLKDPVRRLFNWTYTYLSRTLQRISDRAFVGIDD